MNPGEQHTLIEFIADEDAKSAGDSEERVLYEQRVDHSPEFQAVIGPLLQNRNAQAFFRAPSGSIYRIGAVAQDTGRTEAVEICVRKSADVAPDAEVTDKDLWAFLEWLVGEAGGEWTKDGLRKTGALYKVPGAPDYA